ncbi:hypothetical protein MRB53_006184 [Persea americana]|uniref:Uncharacterized protein n=1 Tax=Persea americana TaxID=3435 RepID=A0ACC2MGG4_PERAE|nr:hypothetical protein MRB53_006184 [Persea americana]
MTEFGVDGKSSKLIYEFNIDAMRLKCDSSPMLQRRCVLNKSTIAFTFCKAKMSILATLCTRVDVDPDIHILPRQNVNTCVTIDIGFNAPGSTSTMQANTGLHILPLTFPLCMQR